MKPEERLALAYAQSHPDDVARIADSCAPNDVAAWTSALPQSCAAALLSRMTPSQASAAVAALPPAAAAGIVTQLAPGVVAGLLRRLDGRALAAIQSELPPRLAEQLALRLSFRADQAGSRVDPLVPALSLEATAVVAMRQVLNADVSHVYVLDAEHTLRGVVAVRELMRAEAEVPLRQLMKEVPFSIRSTAPLHAVVRHPGWNTAQAMPVTDSTGRFVGVLHYSTFRSIEQELGEQLVPPDTARAASALAELLWVGASAVLQLGSMVVLGAASQRRPQQ